MNEEKYPIPPEGSLGLLALGHIGLYAWREARVRYEKQHGETLRSFYSIDKPFVDPLLDAYLNTESSNEKK
ncbi:MAG: hypothetical protein U0T77_02350 [Chitinophagales bacterium]